MRRVILGPTFEVGVGVSAREAAERLALGLAGAGVWVRRSGAAGAAEREGAHFVVALAKGERRFWSPWLTFELEEGDGGCVGKGRFNPNPAIWTGFVLASIVLVGLGFGGIVWSWAEVVMERPVRGVWVTVASALGVAGLWGVSGLGQWLARAEMARLEGVVREILR